MVWPKDWEATVQRVGSADQIKVYDTDRNIVARSSQTISFGGGSVPGYSIPSWAIVLPSKRPERLSARLRTGMPSVMCRVEGARIEIAQLVYRRQRHVAAAGTGRFAAGAPSPAGR